MAVVHTQLARLTQLVRRPSWRTNGRRRSDRNEPGWVRGGLDQQALAGQPISVMRSLGAEVQCRLDRSPPGRRVRVPSLGAVLTVWVEVPEEWPLDDYGLPDERERAIRPDLRERG